MKPIKLILSAYGPYAGVVEIPFERFGGRGIFLITGDTGAGKTTIFDGITYALFGSVNGSLRTTATLRSDFADARTETYAELEFSHQDKVYRIRRSPEYQRPKKSGSGVTKKAAEAELQMPCGKVLTKQREIDEAVRELLGVDYRQWMQISMIAQGEFQKLLNADSRTRGEIFRRIFNTEPVLWAQMELSRQLAEKRKTWENGRQSIRQYMKEIILPEEDARAASVQELKNEEAAVPAEEALRLVSAILAEDSKQEQILGEQIYRQRELLEELNQRCTLAEHMNRQFFQLRLFREKKERLIEEQDAMQEVEKRVTAGKKALYEVRPFEVELLSLLKQKEELTQQRKELRKELAASEIALQTAVQKEAAQGKNQEELQRLALQTASMKEKLSQYGKLEQAERDLRLMQGTKEQAEQTEKEAGQRYENALKERDDLMEVPGLLRAAIVLCEEQTEAVDKIQERIRGLMELGGRLEQYSALLERQEESRRAYGLAEAAYLKASRAYEHDELIYWREQAGIMAAELVDGQPCPVCGSTAHPQKAELSLETCTKEMLAEEKEEVELLRAKVDEKSKLLAGEAGAVLMTKQELDRMIGKEGETWNLDSEHLKVQDERQVYEERLAAAKDLLCESRKRAELLKGQQQRMEELERQISVLRSHADTAQRRRNEAFKKWAEIKERYGLLKSQLEWNSEKDAREELARLEKRKVWLEQMLEEAAEQVRQHRSQVERIQTLLQEKEKQQPGLEAKAEAARTVFIAIRKNCGFESELDYQSFLREPEQLSKWEQELADYRKAVAEVEVQLSHFEKETKDQEDAAIGALDKERQEHKQQLLRLEGEIQSISVRIAQNVRIEEKLKKNIEENGKAEREYLLVKELADTANGMLAGKQKIAFEQYVQASYFDEVLHCANQRLTVMSNNRYQLQRQETAGDLKSQSGLDLDVLDAYTGKRRAVRSLSGGESFQASLSLALGMSDVMQRSLGGIRLDTLFIDEGFGSLDQNSMDQAVAVLQDLTEGDRLIGIISHVTELKESVSQKIIVSAGRGRDQGKGSRVTLSLH